MAPNTPDADAGGDQVGVLRDSRDRSPAANRAFAGRVHRQMNYLESHKDTLIPEFRAVWAATGYQEIRNLGGGLRSPAPAMFFFFFF